MDFHSLMAPVMQEQIPHLDRTFILRVAIFSTIPNC